MKKLKISLSMIVMLLVSGGVALAVVQTLNGQSGQTQTFSNDNNVIISSASDVHSLSWNGHLSVSRGGTGTGSFTVGSVLFSSAASVSQDNSNLFWDNTNKRLGIGTKTPLTALDVKGTVTAQQVATNSVVASGSNQSISLSPTGTGKVSIGGESLVVARLDDEPASGSTGQIYFDRSLGKFRGFNGTSWVSLRDTESVPVRVLVVAGGGGSTHGGGAGGGGAGGVVYSSALNVTAQAYVVTVGSGGVASNGSVVGGNGGNSVFSTITATGGGGGGFNDGSGNGDGIAGGSGGGGGGASTSNAGGATGGTGFTNIGGAGIATNNIAAGGGGAGGAGASGSGTTGGLGGAGIADASVGDLLAMTSSGVSGFIAGGGGGYGTDTAGTGGSGGGGASAAGASDGSDGTANTGSGGGGGSTAGSGSDGHAGGSGIVIVVYPTAMFTHTGGDATGTSGSETWVKFTASGTLTFFEN